jgi:hypothetical protein
LAKKSANPLPKTLAGAVCAQSVRCGKVNCRCAKGQPHTAYYRFWRDGGRLRKAYVPRQELEQVREACQARRRERLKMAESMAEWRRLVSLLREQEGQS